MDNYRKELIDGMFAVFVATNEGTYLGVQALLSSDLAHKTDSIPKDRIPLGLLSRVIGILLEIDPMIPKHRLVAF